MYSPEYYVLLLSHAKINFILVFCIHFLKNVLPFAI